MKRFSILSVTLFLLITVAFGAVTDYVPEDSSMVFTSVNNSDNYSKLKEETVFGFLLRDMGVEGMISQQVESMKYADPEFKPENIWALLKGDIAVFTQGEINYGALAQMNKNMADNPSASVNPNQAIGQLGAAFANLDFAVVLKPAANPDDVLAAVNKLMPNPVQFGQNDGFVMAKDNGHVIISMNQKGVDAAMAAKGNNIMNDPIFSGLYNEENWMILYTGESMSSQKMMSAYESAFGFDFPDEMSKMVKMEYGWTKGYVDGGLVLESFNKYQYNDSELQRLSINAGVSKSELEDRMRLPGLVKGAVNIANMDKIWGFLDPMMDALYQQVKQMYQAEMEELDAATYEMVKSVVESWDGLAQVSMDMKMGETGDVSVDLYGALGSNNPEMISALIEESGEALKSLDGMKYMKLSETTSSGQEKVEGQEQLEQMTGTDVDVEPYLIIEGQKIIITTIKPEQFDSVMSEVPSINQNQMYSQLSGKFAGVENYYGMFFLDISDLLTKLMGMGYPSAIYSEFGVDEEGNSQAITVIK